MNNKGKPIINAVKAPDNAVKAPSQDAPHPHARIRTLLRRRLLLLNYHAFAQCLCRLLTRLGYEDVAGAGRTRWKGRNRAGGYDIEAFLPAGVGRRPVIVQAKQFDALPIFQRSVDELRGACLRAGAAEALLITTSAFSSVVRQNTAQIGPQVAPVRLLDGEGLLDLLLRHRIGVREEKGEGPDVLGGAPDVSHRLRIDEAFFEALSRDFTASGRPTFAHRSTPLHRSTPFHRSTFLRRSQHECNPKCKSTSEYKSNSERETSGKDGGERACWLVTVRVGSPGLLNAGRRTGGKGGE